MPLISNKDRYPNDTNISSNDYVIGTDGNSGLTKTFQLDDLQSILNSAGYTRAQMLTIIGNNGLKEGVEYKITDAGNDDETIVVKASSSSELFRMCYNLNDTSDLYQYNISTDSLLVFSPSALGDMTKAVYDQANIAQQVVGTTATQTLTNKTLEDYSNHIHADVLHVRAKATENISKGQAVVITGYNVGEAAEEVALANNTTGVASGIAYENITTGNFGLIVTAGILENVDTSAFSEGVILYVNGSGNLTPTEPSIGFAQPIAYVLRSNANTGALQILASYPKQDAADVRFTPAGDITATDVQAALQELDAEKAAVSHTHDASAVISGTFADARISQSSVTQHQAALSITESQISDLSHDADLIKGVSIDASVATPSDGDILVYRTAGSDWVLEAKPAGGSNPALNDVTDVTITSPADNEVLAYDTASGDWINQTAAEAGLATSAQGELADTALQPSAIGVTVQAHSAVLDATTASFTTADETKLDGIEAGADVTDATNVAAAGALMDSEVTNLAAVKAFDPANYATAAQGALADSALQPTDIDTLAELNALLTDATLIDTNDSRLSDARTPLAHTHTHADITDYDTEIAGKTNTTAYTPTADYHPATKKYVDDAIVSGGGYTDAQAQDAVGAILTDTAEIDFTYDAVSPKTITASLKASSIDESKLDASVNASLDKADSAIQSGDLATVATTGSYTDLIDKPTIPTRLSELSDVDASVSSPSDGDILVFRNAGNDWVLEAKPEGGSNPALSDITDVTLSGVADNEVLAYDSSSGDWINQTASEAGLATAAQGAKADSALQDLVNDTTPQLGGDLDLNGNKILALPCEIGIACSDETTALTTGTAKATFRMPYAMTLTAVRASLTGAGSTSGTTTIDINEAGTTVLSTKLTIDAGEKTSTTAATPAVISDSALADDAEITIDIDAVSGGADETGLKVWLIGTRA